jgi:hypothetical protein
MDIWKEDNEKYLLEYWGSSPISWQRENRKILNSAIKVYNEYINELTSLNKVVKQIKYAEKRLKNECGTYLEDIVLMKNNVSEIEEIRRLK